MVLYYLEKEVFLLMPFFFNQRYKILSLAKRFHYRFTFFELPVKVRACLFLLLWGRIERGFSYDFSR